MAGLLLVLVFLCALPLGTEAQTPTHALAAGETASEGDDAAPSLPSPLTPDLVDATLAELSDEQVRRLLREELQRQADEAAAASASEMNSIADATRRLDAMFVTIAERMERWREALGNIEEWRDRLIERLALGSAGPWGILGAFLLMLGAGLAAAFATIALLRHWRGLVAGERAGAPPEDRPPESGRPGEMAQRGYWEGLARTAVLTLIDLLPVAAFSLATTLFGRLLAAPLGPLTDYIWIFQAGVTNGWTFIVLLNRAFAPDVPSLRIASVDDTAAQAVVSAGRLVVAVAVAGWLIAGLAPTLGLGFPPAMVTVAATGLIVTAMLILAVLRHRHGISAAVMRLLPETEKEAEAAAETPWQRLVARAAPFLALLYIFVAASFWLLNWLESGQLYLRGPSSTILVLLALPLFDRLGHETAAALTRRSTPRLRRLRAALVRLWRLVLAIVAVGVITRLWGFNFFDLAHGPGAPSWRAAALNTLWALIAAWASWQLIRAVLWQERRTSTGAEEDDNAEPGGASRLDTLLPLFRIALGLVLVVTLALYALAEAGLNIGPLLASAGIVGIAVGFGAQTLVRDIFSGIFFLVDDAFRVGEYIELEGDLRGEVENISIRSLQLRHHRGAVVTIPFGELKSVTNHNRDWVIYKMNFRMEPETDPKKFKKLVKQIGFEFLESPEHGHKFIEPLKSQGVYMVDDDSALVFRVKFKCKPRQQFVLRREIYHRLREVFSENDMHLSRRKVEVVQTGESDGPPGLPDDVLQPKPAAPAA
ncbi:MAG: mechanosensitive ion channel family protein [Pseudomonadota bacterium]